MCIICIQLRKYVINKTKKITNFYQFIIIAKMRFCIEFHLKQKFIIFIIFFLVTSSLLHISTATKLHQLSYWRHLLSFLILTFFFSSVLHTILLFMTAPEAHMNQAQTHYNPISLSLPWMFGFPERREMIRKWKQFFIALLYTMYGCV